MGVTEWPCPRCGQKQRREHPNGEAQAAELCAACTEEVANEKAPSKRR